MTFDLDLWPTDLNINRGHLLIKDYLPTTFEASDTTLPDSAGVSRIFNNFLRKSHIDIFSRQERSFPRILPITSRREIALDQVVFHTFSPPGERQWPPIKVIKTRSRLSKHASLTLNDDCTICLIVLITSTGLITPMNWGCSKPWT